MEELDFGTPSKQSGAEDRIAWSTDKIEKLLLKIDDGYKPKSTPFYEGNPIFRKGNIVFDYTPKEISEIQKCATDIVYFANNYCTVMTDEGLRTIELRDYQEKMLEHFVDNRLSIVLASRQIGKCFLATATVKLKISNIYIKKYIPIKYCIEKEGSDIYEVPTFVLYRAIKKSIKNYTIYDRLKNIFYKLYSKLN